MIKIEHKFSSDEGKYHLMALKQDDYLESLDVNYLRELFKHVATELLILTDRQVDKYEAAKILGKSVSWIEKASSNPKTRLQRAVHKCRIKDGIAAEFLTEETLGSNTGVTFSQSKLVTLRDLKTGEPHA